MNELTFSFAPNGLLTFDIDPSKKAMEAYFYTVTKAQMVARATNPDPSSVDYYTVMIEEMSKFGWAISKAPSYYHKAGGDPVTPLEIFIDAILDFVRQMLPFFPINNSLIRKNIPSITTALKNIDSQTHAEIDSWWNGMAFSIDMRFMTLGRLLEIIGMPWMASGFFCLKIDTATSWEVLITPSNKFALTALPMIMMLNLSIYEKYEVALKAELEAGIKNHIHSVEIDFGS